MAKRHFSLIVLALVLPAALASAQTRPASPNDLHLHAYGFQHREAADAVPLVRPLLSPRGAILVKADGKTLVVRDTVGNLARVVPMLRSLDQPVIPLDLEVMLVRAERSVVSPPAVSTIPEALAVELASILPYDTYLQVARAELQSWEGEEITYEVGAGYELRFRLGRYQAGSVRVHDFQVYRKGREQPLVHANLVLTLGQTYSLGLSRSESSPTALMVVLTCQHRVRTPPARR